MSFAMYTFTNNPAHGRILKTIYVWRLCSHCFILHILPHSFALNFEFKKVYSEIHTSLWLIARMFFVPFLFSTLNAPKHTADKMIHSMLPKCFCNNSCSLLMQPCSGWQPKCSMKSQMELWWRFVWLGMLLQINRTSMASLPTYIYKILTHREREREKKIPNFISAFRM